MKTISVLIACFLVVSIAWCASSDDIGALADAGALRQWIYHYYQAPDPEAVIPAIKSMIKNGLFDYPESCTFLSGFLVSIFSQNPDKAATWADQLSSSAFPDPKTIWWSLLMLSDVPGWRDILNKIKKGRPAEEQASIAEMVRIDKVPDMLTRAIDSAGVIDMLWGMYFATGEKRYVQRIITALPGAIGTAAQRYLRVYAGEYPAVLAICKSELGSQPEAGKKVLTEVISLAEQDMNKTGGDPYSHGVLRSGR